MDYIIKYFNDLGFNERRIGRIITGDGLIDDYHVNYVIQPGGLYIIAFDFYLEDRSKVNEINQQLAKYNSRVQRLEMTNELLGISIRTMSSKKAVEILEPLLKVVMETLDEYQVLKSEYCPHCGRLHDDTSLYTDNIIRERLHKECNDKILNEVNNEKQTNIDLYENQPSNFGKGFLGILLAGILGFIVNLLLMRMGLIGLIGVFVSLTFGIRFYIRFGGKVNYLMLISLILVSFVFFIASIFVSYGILGIEYFKQQESVNYDLFTAFKNFIQINEVKVEFQRDLLISIIFFVIYSLFDVLQVIRMIKGLKDGTFTINNRRNNVQYEEPNNNEDVNESSNEHLIEDNDSNEAKASNEASSTEVSSDEEPLNRYRYEEEEEENKE